MSTIYKLCEAAKKSCTENGSVWNISFLRTSDENADYWYDEAHNSARSLSAAFFNCHQGDYPQLKFEDSQKSYRILFQKEDKPSFVIVKEHSGSSYTWSSGPTLNDFKNACDAVIITANKNHEEPKIAQVFDVLTR